MKYIECKYCKQLISANNISKHINSHENGNFDKYQKHKENFENISLNCRYCNKLCKNRNSLAQHEIRCNNNPNKIDMSKCFNNCSHNLAWNHGLTKDTDERVNKSAQTYKKNHKLGLHKDTSGENNTSSRLEVKNKISQSCLKRSKNGTWHTSLAKNMHYAYKENDLHGTWEVAYAVYLDENNIDWIRNTKRFEYFYKGKKHYYTPDFYLTESDEYIEIKGYSTGKDYSKWKQFPKDKKLTVLKFKDLVCLGVFNTNYEKFCKK